MNFPDYLRAELARHRISARQLARKSGVDHGSISKILRGRSPNLATAQALVSALRVPFVVTP